MTEFTQGIQGAIKKLLTEGASTWFFTHTTAKTARKKWISSQKRMNHYNSLLLYKK